MRNLDRFTKSTFWRRNKTSKGMRKAATTLKNFDWSSVLTEDGAEQKAVILVDSINMIMDDCFPLQKITLKNTDNPWITPYIKSRIRSRKRTFGKHNRGEPWREKKKETDDLVKQAKSSYYTAYVKKAKEIRDPSLYYKTVQRLKGDTASRPFSVTDLFPGIILSEAAEKAAVYFTKISDSFRPLSGGPNLDNDSPIVLTEEQVMKRIQECKKPIGLLSGDVWPELLVEVAKEISVPLTSVYNSALKEGHWPSGMEVRNSHHYTQDS